MRPTEHNRTIVETYRQPKVSSIISITADKHMLVLLILFMSLSYLLLGVDIGVLIARADLQQRRQSIEITTRQGEIPFYQHSHQQAFEGGWGSSEWNGSRVYDDGKGSK